MKKIIMAVFSRKAADEIVQGAHFTNRTFGGFINGQIIDSFIIGLICFIVMTLFGWEYTLLISCIIGITNIIPFFGPFIGANTVGVTAPDGGYEAVHILRYIHNHIAAI